MKFFNRVTIGILLAAFSGFGQSKLHTYTGDVVSANCMQAANIVNRNSRGYIPAGGANAFTREAYKPLNTPRMRKSILRHCSINPGTTGFALLDPSGNFFRLDEVGNFQVLSQTSTRTRRLKATITGSVDRETLNVKAVSAMPAPERRR